MSPKQTQTNVQWSVEDLYNMLMHAIEPDLTTDMLPHLDAVYEGENTVERKKRGQRYRFAFEKCFALMHTMYEELGNRQKQAMQNFQQHAENQKQDRMAELEHLFEEE